MIYLGHMHDLVSPNLLEQSATDMYKIESGNHNIMQATSNANVRKFTVEVVRPPYVPTVERDVLKACQLSWWAIRGYDKGINAKYERRGWFGLTVTNISQMEDAAINKWAKHCGKHLMYMSKRYWDCGGGGDNITSFVGSYDDYDYVFWFISEDLRLAFIRFLESFPKRTSVMLIRDRKKAMPFIKDINFKMLVGSDAVALALPDDIDPTNLMLLRLAAM